ncbi:MAG: tetratricopeptide repeat protein [Candidatus Tritonobacter lacicola]|nr:tetratricopeptide repeat protein [Candidatus Tritonobacter lacicola]
MTMHRHSLIAFLLIAVTLAVYWPVCGYDFVQFDDSIHVYDNPYLNPVTLSSVLHLWLSTHKRLYIPLTWSVWAMAAGYSRYVSAGVPGVGLNPCIFHTVNLTLHLLTVLAVFAILRMLLRYCVRDSGRGPGVCGFAGSEWAAGFGALLFALHPLQVQAVAWVTGMKDVLSGFLSMVAMWQYIAYVIASSGAAGNIENNHAAPVLKRRARLHYIAASVAFILALLSKPVAVAVLPAAWVVDCCVLGRPARKGAAALIGWAAAAAPIVLLAKLAQPAASVLFVPPLLKRLLVAGDAVAFYCYKLFLPFRLGIDYGRTPDFVLRHGWIYLTGILPWGAAALICLGANRRIWLASLAIFIAGILPVSGLIPGVFSNISTVQDHYLYFAMLGPALALAWFLSLRRGALTRVFCALIVGLLGMLSVLQCRTWQNSITLFEHALEVNPDSWFVHTSLGVVLVRQGKLDEAIFQYREAIRVKPGFSMAHCNLGHVLAAQGKYDEAVSHYREALLITPDFTSARKGLRYALRKTGEM